MLQIDVCPFASDALEDAMKLAQTKSLNNFTFSDCLSYLNYVWADIYSQICMIDSGYYSVTVQLKNKLTKIPPFVRNSLMVYAAQRPVDYNRQVFRQSGPSDYASAMTYNISGTDLLCPDAERRTVWLEYCPQPTQIFFTHFNRDPKLLPDTTAIERISMFNLYKLVGIKADNTEIDVSNVSITYTDISTCTKWVLRHRNVTAGIPDEDITRSIIKTEDKDGKWELKYISCDFPYIFCSYQHSITGNWHSGFFDKNLNWTEYNPFEFTGRESNVEYIEAHWNDKTGLGVIVHDWSDLTTTLLNIAELPKRVGSVILVDNTFEYKATDGVVYTFTPGYWFNRFATDFNYEQVPTVTVLPATSDEGDTVLYNGTIQRYFNSEWSTITVINEVAQEQTSPKCKELGWTPDTRLVYPAPEVYRYLVARLAEKFSALNESNIMGVQSELVDAKFAFQAFLKKDKSAWERMRNVNLPTPSDWL